MKLPKRLKRWSGQIVPPWRSAEAIRPFFPAAKALHFRKRLPRKGQNG